MNTLPRFIKEYAHYLKNRIGSSELMKPEYRKEKTDRIDRILNMVTKGYITIPEAMKALSEIQEG